MRFTCDICNGICCFSPPQIGSSEDSEKALKYAKEYEIEILAVEMPNGKYTLAIAQKNGKCPFLNDSGKCSIYEDRFEVCRDFECKEYNEKISMQNIDKILFGTLKSKVPLEKRKMAKEFRKEEIKSPYIRVVDIGTALGKVNKVNINKVVKAQMEVIDNFIKRGIL